MYKVIIVDDEKWIRKGIISKLKKVNLDIDTIEEASNGTECIEKVKLIKPDIIICDIRMGDLNGLELCQILKNTLPNIKIIIISGYNEFNYAKKALQIGAVDYLLKPIDTYDLFKSLQKCIEYIQTEKQEQLMVQNRSMLNTVSQIREKILEYLKNGYLDFTEIFSNYSENTSLFKCVYLYVNNFISVNIFSYIEHTLKHYPYLKFMENVAFIENKQNEYILLYMLEDRSECNKMEDVINKVNLNIIKLMSDLTLYDYTFGVSEVNKSARKCIGQAFHAMKHRIMIDSKNIISFNDIVGYDKVYKVHSKNIIRYALNIENLNKVEELLKEIYNEVNNDNISYTSLQNLYSTFIMIINEEFGIDIESKMMFYPKEIYFFNSIKEMFNFIKDILLNIVSLSSSKPKDYKRELVLKVKEYIDRNYSEELTLESISSNHHISSCYLSIIFKEVMQTNFQEYIINIRIERAKKLLRTKEYKIKDVAFLTGFNNQHYFSRIFKRITEMTPREYRELHS